MKEIIFKNDLMMFIEEHEDWKGLLSSDPYNLIIKEDEDFPNVYLFKYNMLESDMYLSISQEARGIIIEVSESNGMRYTRLLAHSFDKFFNYTEPQGVEVLKKFNWNNYSFQEKRDGSLMRLWFYKDRWVISSSGTIDAHKAQIQIPSVGYNSFGDMFDSIFQQYNIDLDSLDPGITYSFEMTSPDNKIVVDYDKDELTLIGMRVNKLNMELDPILFNPFDNIKTAERFQFNSIDDALSVINSRSNFEGLVLVDDSFNRVKIKTEEYLALAKMSDMASSDRGILRMILAGTIDDVSNRLPHLQPRIDIVKGFVESEISNIKALIDSVDFSQDRKTIALSVKNSPYARFVFPLISNPDQDVIGSYFISENLEKIYKAYKDRFNISEENDKEVE